MREIYRVMDANFNRAREGLRVLEEIARFILEDGELSSMLKDLRHKLSSVADELPGGMFNLVKSRDAAGDVGSKSWTEGEKNRSGILILAVANLKRVQEAMRVLEEFGKIITPEAEAFKKIRFDIYIIEQLMFVKIADKGFDCKTETC